MTSAFWQDKFEVGQQNLMNFFKKNYATTTKSPGFVCLFVMFNEF